MLNANLCNLGEQARKFGPTLLDPGLFIDSSITCVELGVYAEDRKEGILGHATGGGIVKLAYMLKT
jgi:hypothetical protein